VIVRWGLGALPGVIEELSISRPLLISTERWRKLELPVARRFHGVRPHAELSGVYAALDAVDDADGLVALGGGSALDTAKCVSSQTGLALISIPTTYSGAEWTGSFGVRDPESRTKTGGAGARTIAIVYEASLTVDLSPSDSAGSAMNALAHCAEALYAPGRGQETDAEALAGAPLISTWLPVVVEHGRELEPRRSLLEGAMHAGAALRAGMGLGHAMAQALGGRYGLAHGAMNAVCLPHAMRFNREVAADEIARFGAAMAHGDPIERVRELSGLAGPASLRAYGVPRDELGVLAEAIAGRPAAKANPRPAPPEAILGLLEEIW
jgi:maleylacetate reductase